MTDENYLHVLMRAARVGPRAEEALLSAFERDPSEAIALAEDLVCDDSNVTLKCARAQRKLPNTQQ